jgi:hypothetical protein
MNTEHSKKLAKKVLRLNKVDKLTLNPKKDDIVENYLVGIYRNPEGAKHYLWQNKNPGGYHYHMTANKDGKSRIVKNWSNTPYNEVHKAIISKGYNVAPMTEETEINEGIILYKGHELRIQPSGDVKVYKNGKHLPKHYSLSVKDAKEGIDFVGGVKNVEREERPSQKEETETNESVLNVAQRIKRGQTFKRLQPKLQQARRLSMGRFAKSSQLSNRAERLARKLVKRKFAGVRGYEYQNLSTSEKIQVDKLSDHKTKLIKRLANRLMPKVRSAEQKRMSGVAKGHKGYISPLASGTPGQKPAMISAEYVYEGRNPKSTPKINAEKNRIRREKYKNKIKESLIKKSENSGISYEEISEVFINSIKEDKNVKNAFQSVNSYIANLKESHSLEDYGKLDKHGDRIEKAYRDNLNWHGPVTSEIKKTPTRYLKMLKDYNMGYSGVSDHPLVHHINLELKNRGIKENIDESVLSQTILQNRREKLNLQRKQQDKLRQARRAGVIKRRFNQNRIKTYVRGASRPYLGTRRPPGMGNA